MGREPKDVTFEDRSSKLVDGELEGRDSAGRSKSVRSQDLRGGLILFANGTFPDI